MDRMEKANPGEGKLGRRIAIMQPYFFPYAGYFRLLAYADIFVILDNVQFNRRGRVHRSEVPSPVKGTEWLTLPLKRQSREIRIQDLLFKPEARDLLDCRLQRHKWILEAQGPAAKTIRSYLYSPLASVIDFLEKGIVMIAKFLDLEARIIKASDIELTPNVFGQDRIIKIVKTLHGAEYINSPGGVNLYDPLKFKQNGLTLSFLSPYDGDFLFTLPALLTQEIEVIREDVLKTTKIQTVI